MSTVEHATEAHAPHGEHGDAPPTGLAALTPEQKAELDERFAQECVRRVAADLSMITDRPFSIETVRVERVKARPAGAGVVHISFKLATQRGSEISHGAMIVPFEHAVSLGAWLLMMNDDEVARRKSSKTIDQTVKDALQEIGNFVAGACDAALRSLGVEDVRVRSEGCQGVRAGVRPAFRYTEGSELVVGRARAQLGNGAPFDIITMLPPLP